MPIDADTAHIIITPPGRELVFHRRIGFYGPGIEADGIYEHGYIGCMGYSISIPAVLRRHTGSLVCSIWTCQGRYTKDIAINSIAAGHTVWPRLVCRTGLLAPNTIPKDPPGAPNVKLGILIAVFVNDGLFGRWAEPDLIVPPILEPVFELPGPKITYCTSNSIRVNPFV